MTVGEFKEVAEIVYRYGFKKITMGDLTIENEGTPPTPPVHPHALSMAAQASPDEKLEDKHPKIAELSQMLKMDDFALIEKIFPEPQPEGLANVIHG